MDIDTRNMSEEEIMQLNSELAKDKTYTVDYVNSLPGDVRVEVIDGQLFYMGCPTRTHQRLQVFLALKIGNYIEEHKGECELYLSAFGVRLNKDNKTWVEPDVMVICDTDKLNEKECCGAPDFVVEIISPSSRSKDCMLKLNKYQGAGVREYWILDWERDLILIYRFSQKIMEIHTFEDKIKVGIFDDLEIDFSAFKR